MSADFKDVSSVLDADSVAIIGASKKKTKIGGRPLNYLIKYDYDGDIYPVNPKYEQIENLKCYSDVTEINGEVDLAIIAVPAKLVRDVLDQCVEKGVNSVVIFSSGFAESSDEGRKQQEEIGQVAEEEGIRVCGPNTLGVISAQRDLAATFATSLERYQELPYGHAGLISQSGALGACIYSMAQNQGLGFNHWVSVGNESDLEFSDFLNFLAEDQETKAIGGYLEGVKDGEKFIKAVEKATANEKPVIVTKVGKTQRAAQAAQSHTGKMVGSDEVYDSIFDQQGVIRADDIQQLLDLLYLSSKGFSPQGNSTAILTFSGGAGIWATDKCEEIGIEVPQLSNKTQNWLKDVLPQFGSALNPIDVTAQLLNEPSLLNKSIEIILEDPNIDFLTVLMGLQEKKGGELAEGIIEASQSSEKPVFSVWIAGAQEANRKIDESGIPVFDDMARGFDALGKLVKFEGFLSQRSQPEEKAPQVGEFAGSISWPDSEGGYTEYFGKQVLKDIGVNVPRGGLVGSKDKAAKVAAEIGFPVVLKAVSSEIKHKSDMDLIEVGVEDQEELFAAHERIRSNLESQVPDASRVDILVEEMVPSGLEVNVGSFKDGTFGPVIVFGLGGIYVELFKDTSMRQAPVTTVEAERMIEETKASNLISGFRGDESYDKSALVDVLVKVSKLVSEERDRIKEFEINPLIVRPEGKGAVCVDVLLNPEL
ncbi:acetate--CoA ligase family protein [Candidatus Bipolaricaulota bacterium]|nr:acetate--CoA ligase family protein [Candidatus Bipolaricaulota bacterium]